MPPPQKPGKSEQDVETPADFVVAVEALIGSYFVVDLAAGEANAKAAKWYTKEANALVYDWADWDGWCWLNPPYGNIAPWAQKCAEEGKQGTKIALLVPAAVGSNWYRDYVESQAYVFFLNPRLKFVGHKTSYPKDLMLCLYGDPHRGQSVWRWKQ